MRYLSVCSGIEAATVAWHPLGWEAFAYSEIEAFPAAVLAHHYPNTPNFGDMTKFKEWPHAAIDLLVGGTPCQSFSVAGLRKGLDDPRGNLMLTYLAIAAKYRPTWLVWENVPGVLSSNGGRDFGTFLAGLGQLGYGFAYRVLDAQYFGVAQRRRRVFVIGCLGNWRAAAAVLFERESLSGNPAPRREAGKAAPTIPSRSTAGGGLGTDFDCDGGLIAGTIAAHSFTGGAGGRPEGAAANHFIPQIARCVTTGEHQRQDYETCTLVAHALRGEGFDASEDGTGRGTPLVPVAGPLAFDCKTSGRNGFGVGPISPTLRSMNSNNGNQNAGGQVAVAFSVSQNSNGFAWEGDVHATLQTGNKNPEANSFDGIRSGMQVRRLTPRECERLQGFPDDYTLINVRGKPAADGPRYKALGNSMAVPVMHWIGRRIQVVSSIKFQRTAA